MDDRRDDDQPEQEKSERDGRWARRGEEDTEGQAIRVKGRDDDAEPAQGRRWYRDEDSSEKDGRRWIREDEGEDAER